MVNIEDSLNGAKVRLWILEEYKEGSKEDNEEAKERIELYEYMKKLPEEAKYWIIDTQIFREIMVGYVGMVLDCYTHDRDPEIADAANLIRSRILLEMLKITECIGAEEAEEYYKNNKNL